MGSLLRRGAEAISPTAHYTGYVWARHGLGDCDLATREGRLLHGVGQLALAPVDRLGGPTLEHFLLARHRIIDRLLESSLDTTPQIVELACGMSPRGLDFVRRHPSVTYVEVDLPAMAARKRAALHRIGTDSERHRVVAADVFGADLDEAFASLDPTVGVAVVTEGLLNYFSTASVRVLWHSVVSALAGFPQGLYLSDLHLDSSAAVLDRLFAAGLGVFVRGRVYFHFRSSEAAIDALGEAGFTSAQVHAPSAYASQLPGMSAAGADRVRVVEAHTG